MADKLKYEADQL